MSLGIAEQEAGNSLGRGGRRPRASRFRQHLERSLVGLTLALAFSWGARAFARDTGKTQTIEGKLIFLPGAGPTLKTGTKSYSLSGRTTYLFHTLEDKHLRNREVRLEGALEPDGSFEVERIFTVRHGTLYRIRYFCETCNIEALEPGNCVCCQQPTELQEYPASEGGDPKPEDIAVLH